MPLSLHLSRRPRSSTSAPIPQQPRTEWGLSRPFFKELTCVFNNSDANERKNDRRTPDVNLILQKMFSLKDNPLSSYLRNWNRSISTLSETTVFYRRGPGRVCRKNKHCKSTPFEELYMKDKAWNTSLHLYACAHIYRWIDYSARLKIRLWLPSLLMRSWYYLCLDKLFALIRWGNWIIRSKIYVWENNALERTLFWEETCYSPLSGKVIWFARMGTKRKILALGSGNE